VTQISKKKYFCLVGAALMLAACRPAQVSVKPVMNWRQADAALAGGDFYALGKSYLKSSDLGLAIDAFREDLRWNGDSVRALNGLGVAYDMLGRYDLSQKYYERALDLDPASSVTFGNLAYSQYTQGEYDAAVILANRAEELLASPQEGGKNAERVILVNLEAAGEEKMKEEKLNSRDAVPGYRVQRTGERDWEIMKAWQRHASKKAVPYGARISLEQILGRAQERKEARLQQDLQPKKFSCRLVNGTGRPQMAKRMASFLGDQGLQDSRLANAASYDHGVSLIEFAPGYAEEANKLAQALPVPVRVAEARGLKVQIEFTLGADLIPFDASLFQKGRAS